MHEGIESYSEPLKDLSSVLLTTALGFPIQPATGFLISLPYYSDTNRLFLLLFLRVLFN